MKSSRDLQFTGGGDYDTLLRSIGHTLRNGRLSTARAVSHGMVQTYWEIGRQIVEFEQGGKERAEYGSDMLNRLSRDLTALYGSGFSRSNVHYIRKLYLIYPKVQTLSELLSWSHYIELLMIEDPMERAFYEKECEAEHWGVRELKRQKESMLFHRIALSTEGDFNPVDIIIGVGSDKLIIQYALQNITNQVFVSRYRLYLPDREQLEGELRRFLGEHAEEG